MLYSDPFLGGHFLMLNIDPQGHFITPVKYWPLGPFLIENNDPGGQYFLWKCDPNYILDGGAKFHSQIFTQVHFLKENIDSWG